MIMSAWIELIHRDGSDDYLELCERAMREIQEVHAHRLAEKIRAKVEADGAYRPKWAIGMKSAADLIDPDKE
jgi:hypothetical protein